MQLIIIIDNKMHGEWKLSWDDNNNDITEIMMTHM